MTNELLAADTLIYDLLTPNAWSWPVFADLAPDDAEPPFFLFAFQSGDDSLGVGDPAARVFTKSFYVVRAFGFGPSYAAVKDQADWMDSVVHKAEGTASDGRRIRIRRTSPARDRVPNGGDWYVALGGVYEIQEGGA